MGTIIMLAISGAIAASSLGWPGIFYVSGGIGLVYSLFLYIYGNNSPFDCKLISMEDMEEYEQMTEDDNKVKPPTPWLGILTSMPFWSLLCAHMAGSWGFFLMIIEIPSIIHGLMDFDIQSVNIYSKFFKPV